MAPRPATSVPTDDSHQQLATRFVVCAPLERLPLSKQQPAHLVVLDVLLHSKVSHTVINVDLVPLLTTLVAVNASSVVLAQVRIRPIREIVSTALQAASLTSLVQSFVAFVNPAATLILLAKLDVRPVHWEPMLKAPAHPFAKHARLGFLAPL